MNSSQTASNEDFLADCTTNVFSLTDITGLKWKKYASACVNSDNTENDPILNAYSIVRAADVLCFWRRVTQAGLNQDDNTPLFDCPKELIIFWYGEEPIMAEFPGPSLHEIEQGTSEDGISTDNLDIFFKAIHSVIEKNLLGDNFVRLGNWFTKPIRSENGDPVLQSTSSLAFSFSIFIHGESSVVASVNIKEKGVVRVLNKKDLQKVSLSIGHYDGRVLLAPFGLNAHLTGHSIPDTDSRSTKIMNEWKRFFPVEGKQDENKSTKMNDHSNFKGDTLPMIVEVTLGEVKMLYPSSLILVSCSGAKSSTFKSKEKEQIINTAKIVDQIWRKLKKKEEPNSPSKQLWEFKDHSFQTGCKCCSNSNISRVKSNTHMSGGNPFNPSYLYANTNNSSAPAKVKKEPGQPTQTCFHQRPSKNEKLQGRITPLLTGRSTPSLSIPIKPSISTQGSIEKPASVNSIKASGSVEQQTVLSVAELQSLTKTQTTSSLASFSDSKIYQQKAFKKNKPKPKDFYRLPKSFDFIRPILTEGLLESRTAEKCPLKLEFEVKKEEAVTSPGSVFHDENDIISVNVKSEFDQAGRVEDPNKKMKDDNQPVKRGPGRPKGRRNSNLSTSQVMSPINIEDDLLSPNTRRHSTRQMLRGNRKRDSPTPSPVPDSPTHTGPGRQKKSRKSTRAGEKTPNTSTENAVFTFSHATTKPIVSLSSPNTPLLPPSVKPPSTSLTSQKDIEVSEADLMHLFDDEEDDDAVTINKIPSSNASILSPYSSDEHMSSATPLTSMAAISTHDLAHMFPTPPSLEDQHTHQTMSPTTIDSHQMMITHSISPAQTPHCVNYEHDTHHINSPLMDFVPTFQLPKAEKVPIPEEYKPLRLPSEKLPSLSEKYSKYVPSWDRNQIPPLLRPSSNNNTNRALPITSIQSSSTQAKIRRQSSVFDSKLSFPSLISPSLSQRTFSDATTPSLMPQDHQSLLLNLRLNDSCISWMNRQTGDYNSTSVQDRTYRTFNVYQNLLWKTSMVGVGNQPLFPEDNPLDRAVGLVKRNVCDIQASKFPFSTDLVEILAKQFSSSNSIKYFHMLLSQYYFSTDETNCKSYIKDCPEKTGTQQKKLLLNLRPILETALHKLVRKTIFDKPKIQGPLTFREMNNNKENNCSNVPTSSGLIFSYDSDTVSVSPESIKHWQRLFLEPFGGPRNVEYIVVLPDTDIVVNGMKLFFKELNILYESLNLGKHTPIVKDFRDGFLRISQRYVSQVADITVDPWFDQSDSNIIAKMKVVAQFLKKNLGSYLANIVDTDRNTNKRLSSPMSPNNASNGGLSLSSISSNSLTVSIEDSFANSEREDQPFIVLYMVDPFHNESKINNYPSLWSYVGLMKCFLEMRNDLNDFLKENLLLEIIPLEQILQLSTKTGQLGGPYNAELKKLALSVYTKCRPNPLSYMNKIDKCMTGFGVCHIRENLIRRRKVEKNLPVSIFMPPYILSPSHKYLNHDVKSATKAKDVFTLDKDVNVLFCCYCLSTDKQWMFVSCTDCLGEINETTMIRIVYPKKKKNKALIWSVSLRKLWEFLSSVLSFSTCQWRIVLSKYGDVGQQELKEIQGIVDKNMEILVPETKTGRPLSPLMEKCIACSNDPTKKGSYLYKSISFCTVRSEPSIDFVRCNGVRNNNAVNSRIYVMPSRKIYNNSNNKSMSNNGGYGGGTGLMTSSSLHQNTDFSDAPSLLNTSFEEDSDNFIPMLSSPGENLFQSSPQTELSKILSPQNNYSPHNPSSMPSLSPFQPIQNKQLITTPVKNTSSRDCDSCECLCEGYLVAMRTLVDVDIGNIRQNPSIVKSELLIHSASGETRLLYNPLDTNNHLDVLKYILEKFEMLSWLTVDPATGKRQSILPVHIKSALLGQDILKWLTDG